MSLPIPHVPHANIRPVGFVLVRVVGVRDRYILSDVVALRDTSRPESTHLYILYDVWNDEVANNPTITKYQEQNEGGMFVVPDFTSGRCVNPTPVLFVFYEPNSNEHPDRHVYRDYSDALRHARNRGGGHEPILFRSNLNTHLCTA